MPELPEVEVVRRGLQRHLAGRTITAVRVHHPRAVRRHEAGAGDLTARLVGMSITATGRRGKYLWLTLGESGGDDAAGPRARGTTPLAESGGDDAAGPRARGTTPLAESGGDDAAGPRARGTTPLGESGGDEALVVHLGMSGQMLLGPVARSEHVRISALLDDGTALSFVDQRTFGGWMLTDLVDDGSGSLVPAPVAHIARDPLDPDFDRDAVVNMLRHKHSEIKRQLLDQTVVSGIGNIYADESLWRAKVNGFRLAENLSRPKLAELLDHAADVMREALEQGGTSFDSLYVNVNGESGYFDRSLDAYGRDGLPCRRCGAVMRREKFMNRSSFYCPKCQPRPRG